MSEDLYIDERSKLEQEIFRLVQGFEERTGFLVSEVQFVRDKVSRPTSNEAYPVLIGVRVEIEGKH